MATTIDVAIEKLNDDKKALENERDHIVAKFEDKIQNCKRQIAELENSKKELGELTEKKFKILSTIASKTKNIKDETLNDQNKVIVEPEEATPTAPIKVREDSDDKLAFSTEINKEEKEEVEEKGYEVDISEIVPAFAKPEEGIENKVVDDIQPQEDDDEPLIERKEIDL